MLLSAKLLRNVSLVLTVGCIVAALGVGLAAAQDGDRQRRTLAFWDFAGESIEVARGRGAMDHQFSSITFYNGTDVNAPDDGDREDGPGRSLALRGGPGAGDDGTGGNNGAAVYFLIHTAGYEDVEVSLAARRSGTGFTTNRLAYSTDGGRSFTEIDEAFEPATRFTRHVFDLADLNDVNNQDRLILRITFHGATHPQGNNRLDNIHFRAHPRR